MCISHFVTETTALNAQFIYKFTHHLTFRGDKYIFPEEIHEDLAGISVLGRNYVTILGLR
jgi:hypothetical protein